jgi:hypothetical protein
MPWPDSYGLSRRPCWNAGAYDCDRVKFDGKPIRIEHACVAKAA